MLKKVPTVLIEKLHAAEDSFFEGFPKYSLIGYGEAYKFAKSVNLYKTGDIFEVRLNKKAIPIKNLDDR